MARDVLRPTTVPRRYAFRHPIVRRAVYEAAGDAWRLRRTRARRRGCSPGAPARSRRARITSSTPRASATRQRPRSSSRRRGRPPRGRRRSRRDGCRRPCGCSRTGNAERRLGLLVPLATALAASGRLEDALATLLEVLEQIPPGQAELRVRLVAACASCENALGRHDAAHARLLACARGVPRPTAAPAGPRCRSTSPPTRSTTTTSTRCGTGASGRRRRREALGDRGVLAVGHRAAVLRRVRAARRARPPPGARSRAPRGSTRCPTICSPIRLDAPYTSASPSTSASATTTRSGTCAAASPWRGPAARASSWCRCMVGLAHALESLGRLREALGIAARRGRGRRLSGQPAGGRLRTRRRGVDAAAAIGDIDHARTAGDEAIAAADGLDDSVLTRATHAHVGVIWLEIGEVDRCMEQFRAVGLPDFPSIEPARRGWMYTVLARVELARGDQAAARRGLDRARRRGRRPATCRSPRRGCCRSARALARRRATRRPPPTLALRAAERAESVDAPLPAARCRTLAGEALAAARATRRRRSASCSRAEAELVGAASANRYRDEAARELRRLGRARHRPPAPRRRGDGLDALSGRELEIADLVASGRTNRDIGGRAVPLRRRRSRATSPASSPSSACPRAPRSPRRSAAPARRSPEASLQPSGRTGGSHPST